MSFVEFDIPYNVTMTLNTSFPIPDSAVACERPEYASIIDRTNVKQTALFDKKFFSSFA
jgi:hypothetical protein